MNELQVFQSEQYGEIRTVSIEGEPWFVAADVCRALEHSNVTAALDRLDEDEKAKLNLGLPGGETNTVNEPGLYALVLGSRKPEAKSFKRWITHDVIPSIRRTGGYQARPMTTAQMFQMQAQVNMEHEERFAALEAHAQESDKRLTAAVGVFRTSAGGERDEWAAAMNQQINELVQSYGLNYQTFRALLYKKLEVQLGIDIERRRANLQKRLRASGATSREAKAVTKIQAIAADAKLRAAFELLVKQEAAYYFASGREARA